MDQIRIYKCILDFIFHKKWSFWLHYKWIIFMARILNNTLKLLSYLKTLKLFWIRHYKYPLFLWLLFDIIFFLNHHQAIVLLSQQEPFNDTLKQKVRNTLMSELNQPFGKPSTTSSTEELNFIRKALQLVLEMGALSTMVVVEMMAQYILATSVFRWFHFSLILDFVKLLLVLQSWI